MRQTGPGQYFITPVEIQYALFDEGGDKVVEIFGEHFRRMHWHFCRQIDCADDGHAAHFDGFPSLGSRAITTPFGRHVNHDGTRFHTSNHRCADDQW